MQKLFPPVLSKRKKKMSRPVFALLITIFVSCLFTALAQGTSFFYTSHYVKTAVIVCLFLAYSGLLFYLKVSNRLQEDMLVYMMILAGILMRCSYVLLSGLYERQHDAGAYTGMGTDFVNPGHIGYIEYIYKFHKLPDLNPYELFAYYHPPFHHIISYLWLQLNILLGAAEALAFENLQIMTLLYSNLSMVVTYRILKTLDVKGTGLYIGLAFMVFHPATIIIAGSVNNDMLTILFMCLLILGSLEWIREKNLKNLVKLALCLGFGMLTKLNSAVLAIPLGIVFLMHFVGVIRSKNRTDIFAWIRKYCIFGVIAAPIGFSWIARNLIRFGEKPGVPVPGETSPMYTALYSLWERLGIPALRDWRLDFPFHPISAAACNNTWVIMFHTSLFAEEYPTDISDILLIFSQITTILAVLFGIATAILLVLVLLNQLTRKEDCVFLLVGYLVMLISFAAFVIIYPYTCSSDFRYVAICLVYVSVALGLGNKYYLQLPPSGSRLKNKITSVIMHIINWGILTILALTTIIYAFWGRW